jgi:hypothetical protein
MLIKRRYEKLYASLELKNAFERSCKKLYEPRTRGAELSRLSPNASGADLSSQILTTVAREINVKSRV